MQKLFTLKRDLPWAKAGTECSLVNSWDSCVQLLYKMPNGEELVTDFPRDTFNDWFEQPIAPSIKLTDKQVRAILDAFESAMRSNKESCGSYRIDHLRHLFLDWVESCEEDKE